jgi:hypothetical protein
MRDFPLSVPKVAGMPFLFTCPHCGAQTYVSEQFAGHSGPCAQCGQTITVPPPIRPAPPDLGPDPAIGMLIPIPLTPLPSVGSGEDAAIRMLIPLGHSGWAIAAGYAGLFAVLFLPAPIALVLGLVAIWDIRRHPKKHGPGRAIFGLVMGAIFTALVLVFLIAAAL